MHDTKETTDAAWGEISNKVTIPLGDVAKQREALIKLRDSLVATASRDAQALTEAKARLTLLEGTK